MFVTEIGIEVVELHRQGLRSVDIAHRLNIAQSTVHYHLRKLSHKPAADAQMRRRAGRRPGTKVQTRLLVAELLARGFSRTEIARRLGLAKSTVTYHAKQLGEEIDARFGQRFDWKLVQAYYDEGHSVRDCTKAFGFSSWSWHHAVLRGEITPRPGFRPVEEIFAAGTRRSRGHLKSRLLRSGLKDGRCEECGISEWFGQPLSMALHHINGDRLDNRLENLQLLCPNCHSQTDTFGGRDRRPGKAAA
jgi:DNA-binding CsgD family transcriptional regulator